MPHILRHLPATARRARSALDALLPQDCLLCAAPHAGSLLCAQCAAELPRLSGPPCPVCALPSPGGTACGACLREPPAFDAAQAVWRYAFPLDQLIQVFKYGQRPALAAWFAEAMVRRLVPPAADLVVPVPIHPQRLARRGFNQSAELARRLARAWRLPLAVEALVKDRLAPPQASLPLEERHRNLRGALRATADLTGRRVLLVDDVMTSGATLDACAQALRARGAAAVSCCVAARALPHAEA
ncbi:MAG: ComF family protein [Betaproteobacteria bacterium]|nr:ComF family protein [Betaproteobacteria bacterium]